MKFTVFQKPEAYDKEIEARVIKALTDNGLIYNNQDYELVVFIGGDGTFLRAAQAFKDKLNELLFFGLNIGNLGYFYDYDLEDLEAAAKILGTGEYKMKQSRLLHCEVEYKDGTKEEIDAVNEVRIENPFHTLICKVKVEGKVLETYRGTGLLVSSAIGTSAYNKSLSGALIDPSLNLMELTEIASIQNNAYRSLGSSIVISGDKRIEFEGDLAKSVIGYDASILDKEDVVKLTFTSSDKCIRVLHKKSYSYVTSWNKSFIR